MSLTATIPCPRRALLVLLALLIGQSVLVSRAGAAPAHRPAGRSIQTLVLSTKDVTQVYGGGFRAFINGVISNKELTSAEKSAGSSVGPTLTTIGRVTGYESVWFRGGRTSYLSVVNSVSQYRDSSIPQALFGQITAHHMKMPKGFTEHLSAFHGVGDGSLLYTLHQRGSVSYGIMFRRGSYLVMVMAGLMKGKADLRSVLKLAAIEDQRIQANG